MAIDPIRFATENPYTKGSTLVAGQEVQTPEGGGDIVWAVETILGFSGGGRIARYQACTIGNIKLAGMSLATTVANTNWAPVRVAFPVRVLAMSVKGEDGGGNAALSIGATVCVDTDGELNGDFTNGTVWGLLLAAVSSGATTVVPVMQYPFGALANA